MAKVAVENSLGNVRQVLQQSGFEVVSTENASGADCCVISGQDDNVMGISEIAIRKTRGYSPLPTYGALHDFLQNVYEKSYRLSAPLT